MFILELGKGFASRLAKSASSLTTRTTIPILCSKHLCLRIVYAETKNSDLRIGVSRCNRSVNQPGLEIC